MTGKPLALMEDLLRIVELDGRVLDPFAGSGTTLLAARNLGLEAVGIEASEIYFQIAKERLDKGEPLETGTKFSQTGREAQTGRGAP